MIFETIKIANFLSFKEAEYDLSNKGLTLITGKNYDNSDRSNGSGKSSILEALVWCLFGETTKRLKSDEIVNREVGDNCFVELNIESNHSEYKIVRYRKDIKHNNDVVFFINGEEKRGKNNNETQDIINKELGVDYKLFTNSVIFPQESKFKFITATDNEKKAILTDLLDLNYIDRAQEIVNLKIKKIDSEVHDLELKKSNYFETVSSLKEEKEKISYKKKNWEALHGSKIEEKEQELKEIDLKIDRYKQNSLSDSELEELKSKKTQLQEKIDKIEEYSAKKDSLKDKYHEKKELFSDYRSKMIPLEQQIEKIDSIGEGECPKCFQNVSKQHLSSLLEEIVHKVDDLKGPCREVKQELSKIKEKLDKLQEVLDKKPKINNKLKEIEETINKNNNLQVQVESNLEKKDFYIKQIEELKKEQNPYVDSTDGFEEKINKINNKCDIIVNNIKERKEELKYLQFWKEGFSNSGMKSFIFDGIVSELNDKIEEYLDEMFDGQLKVELDTQSTTSKGELRQKLSTKILYFGENVSFESLSGGEKRSISLAVDLAMSYIVSQYNNKHFDILVLDEAVDHLDDIGKERFLDLLKVLDKNSIFVISHDVTFQQKFNNMLEIHKENGESRIV